MPTIQWSDFDRKASTQHEHSNKDVENPLVYAETKDCKYMKQWQTQSFPICNALHETNLLSAWYVASGGQNNVWELEDDIPTEDNLIALKTMKYNDPRTKERLLKYNVAALIHERLTSSRHIATMYAFCGTSSLHEFSYYPDLSKQIEIWHAEHSAQEEYPGSIDTIRLLRIAVDVATAISDLHTFDGEAQATVAHGDLAGDQIIFVDGVYKLTDFEWAFFLRWNEKLNKVCPVSDNHLIDTSAPEETIHHHRTEKADVFSMGHIFYSILTGEDVYELNINHYLVAQGVRPFIPRHFHESEDDVHKVLLGAIERCWVGDPTERASAKVIVEDLRKDLERIEEERQSLDGVRWTIE